VLPYTLNPNLITPFLICPRTSHSASTQSPFVFRASALPRTQLAH